MNTISPFEKLANAIVLRAANDYRFVLRQLTKNPKNENAKNTKRCAESFLKSEWCSFLCNLDGEMIINRINEEEKI